MLYCRGRASPLDGQGQSNVGDFLGPFLWDFQVFAWLLGCLVGERRLLRFVLGTCSGHISLRLLQPLATGSLALTLGGNVTGSLMG